jgi:hypothetical protein
LKRTEKQKGYKRKKKDTAHSFNPSCPGRREKETAHSFNLSCSGRREN